jgi:cyclopropane fatty-acyl-phospholipid synthase-like methyltransferase
MNANKALWEKGDFTQVAASMRESGEALVKAIGVKPDMKVLDLGCGDGTTALPAARLGAQVLGVDIASNLVAGGTRAARASVPCSHRSLSTSQGKWFVSRGRAAAWSWATGFQAIRRWLRRS